MDDQGVELERIRVPTIRGDYEATLHTVTSLELEASRCLRRSKSRLLRQHIDARCRSARLPDERSSPVVLPLSRSRVRCGLGWWTATTEFQ